MTLHVEQLSARYGSTTVLREVDLDVRAGQVLALIGANGVGKSTLLNSIAGLHRSARGTVTIDGQSILGKPAHRIAASGLVLVPEGRHLFGELTVLENLTMGMHGLGYLRATAQQEIESVFAKFPILAEFASRRAGLLSGGQQQMLAIGRALVRRPKVLLLDEPSLGLAPLLVQQILDTVRTLASGEVAVILAEQNAAAALRVADRGAILEGGRMVRTDAAAVLLGDEQVSQHYLGGVVDGAELAGVSLGELPPELRERSLAPPPGR